MYLTAFTESQGYSDGTEKTSANAFTALITNLFTLAEKALRRSFDSDGSPEEKGVGIPMIIVVGTTNPTKLAGVERAFKDVFPNSVIEVKGVKVSNRVGEQPIGLDSIYVGALNRALNAAKVVKRADFYVGVEAGLVNLAGLWIDIHVAFTISGNRYGIGTSMGFLVPPRMVTKVITSSKELDVVVDEVFGTRDIGSHGGVIKILTNGLVDRADLVKQAVLMSLLPWIKPELYDVLKFDEPLLKVYNLHEL